MSCYLLGLLTHLGRQLVLLSGKDVQELCPGQERRWPRSKPKWAEAWGSGLHPSLQGFMGHLFSMQNVGGFPLNINLGTLANGEWITGSGILA